jgi:hypothetical protein
VGTKTVEKVHICAQVIAINRLHINERRNSAYMHIRCTQHEHCSRKDRKCAYIRKWNRQVQVEYLSKRQDSAYMRKNRKQQEDQLEKTNSVHLWMGKRDREMVR